MEFPVHSDLNLVRELLIYRVLLICYFRYSRKIISTRIDLMRWRRIEESPSARTIIYLLTLNRTAAMRCSGVITTLGHTLFLSHDPATSQSHLSRLDEDSIASQQSTYIAQLQVP